MLARLLLVLIASIAYSLCAPAELSQALNRTVPDDHLGAVMMLVSDWRKSRARRCYFNRSMTALAHMWYPNNSYPIILMNTKPWSTKDQHAIRSKWPVLDFKFLNIAKVFHHHPRVPFEDATNPLSSLAYKRMCHFFFQGFTQVPELMQYQYLLRLDDDTCIRDNVTFDIFQRMKESHIAYAYSSLWLDDERVSMGMYDFVQDYMKRHHLHWRNMALHNATMRINGFPYFVPAFNTNLEVISTTRYTDPEVVAFLDAVVRSHYIFHRRWGDAPLRVLVAALFWKEHELLRLDSFGHQHSNWQAVRAYEEPFIEF
jgi:hypothetical protein